MWACVVLPLNGFVSTSLIFSCGQLLLYANGARVGVVSGVFCILYGYRVKTCGRYTMMFGHCCLLFAKSLKILKVRKIKTLFPLGNF